MAPSPYLSVVIPSYNEQKNIARGVLDDVHRYLSAQTYAWELILTDDGSTDDTLQLLQAFAKGKSNVKVLANEHAGKGPTVQSGMLSASGEWQLFTDFDQSTPLKEIKKLSKYTDNFDIIIGSREITGAVRGDEPWYRHLMGKGFNFLVQMLAVPGIYDTQCGFKLFSKQASHTLFSNLFVYGRQETRPDAFTGAFDVEALYLARKAGFSIKEVPITWEHHETDRVNPIKDSARMLRDIIRVRLADISGKYRQLK